MAELSISLVVCVCVACGALLGMYLRRVLPPEYLKDDTRQIVNIAIGLIATLAALVLGLMVASAKSSFDARADEVRESGARIIMLDRSLRQYGPETAGPRQHLRQLIQGRIKRQWGTPIDQAQEDAAGPQSGAIEAERRQPCAPRPTDHA